MKDITITTYNGYSTVAGETTLTQVIKEIREGKNLAIVQRIEKLVHQGETEKADRTKKQLPYLTLTANYHQERLAYSIKNYNPVITIDIDKLKDEQIGPLRERIESDPDVLADFLTPKRHGFKVFVYLQSAWACKMRKATFSTREITYEQLEYYHAQMYKACQEHIEMRLGIPVDKSGKDIGRGFFTSFDTQAYLNTELMEKIEMVETSIIPPEKKEKKPGRKKEKSKGQASEDGETGTVEPWEKLEYRKALQTTRRSEKFEPGNRNTFLYTLGNRCYKKGLSEKSVQQLVRQDFAEAEIDIATPIHNAYLYTNKTEEAEKKKEDKKPVITQVLEYLEAHYDIRRNTILERLEFIDFEENASGMKGKYRPLRNKDYNSIFVNLQMAGISCFQNYLKAVIDSNYAKNFNPFESYFYGLKPWDRTTDYIGQLADTVKTKDTDFWKESLRRWIVGMVACALKEEAVNQYVLILYSEQGKGKSTWIRKLLPPELVEYYRNGMIDPGNKDDLLLLSNRLLINMEEFEGAKQGDIAALKRIITQESVTERKVYDVQAERYTRRASFIASTNNRQCMQDMGGNRRFLLSVLTEIDFHTPVDYEGVYAQAIYLLQNGYRYWYEGDEITGLNKRNEQHRMKEPVEENLYVYYRAATPTDIEVKWRPAAALMGTISLYGRIQANRQTQQVLVQVLERDGFPKRMNESGITEYAVIEFTPDQVSANSRRVEEKGEGRMEKGEGKGERQEELPF